MIPGQLPHDLMLTEEQFREIIERATRDDPQGDTVSLNVLRQVAAEMEIDPVALERAVAGVLSTRASPRPKNPASWGLLASIGAEIDRFLPQRSRWLVGAGVGAFVGWLSASTNLALHSVIDGVSVSLGSSASTDLTVGAALALVTLANSLSRRVTGNLDRYLAESLATWGAFGMFWVATFGGVTSDIQTFVVMSIAISAVWGWCVVRRHGLDGAPWHSVGSLPAVRKTASGG